MEEQRLYLILQRLGILTATCLLVVELSLELSLVNKNCIQTISNPLMVLLKYLSETAIMLHTSLSLKICEVIIMKMEIAIGLYQSMDLLHSNTCIQTRSNPLMVRLIYL